MAIQDRNSCQHCGNLAKEEKKMAQTTTSSDEQLFVEVSAIKRLLLYALIRDGASQDDIAMALGINQSTVSRMFPKMPWRKSRSGRD